MSKVKKIKQFNILMETFLGQISPLVGTSYKHYYSKLVKANAIMPIKQFYLYVSPFKTKIVNKDESYFRETTNFKDGNGDGGEIINDICSYFQINDWTLEMNNDDNFPVKFKFPLSLEPIE